MELRHLKYFIAVADTLHFGRAAEQLHIVQSALSKQIQDLENELQTRLFLRDSRNVSLTEAGRIFYEDAKAILSRSAKAAEQIKALSQGYRGRLRIGFVGMAGVSGVLQSFLAYFRTRYPWLLIELVESENHIQIQRLKAGELDVAIVSFPENDGDELESITLLASRWAVGMSSHNPLSQAVNISPEQLQSENFILYGNQQTELMQRAMIASLIGTAPKIAHSANSTISTLTLIAAGYGVALLPESIRHIGVPGVVYKPLAGLTATIDTRICTRRLSSSASVKRFIAAVADWQKTIFSGDICAL